MTSVGLPSRPSTQRKLSYILRQISEADKIRDYDTRNKLNLQALVLADRLGYPTGIRFDPDEPEWPVLYIVLPHGIGQVAWHVPAGAEKYDGHTNEEKEERCKKFMTLREQQ